VKPASDRILTTPSELGDVLSPLVTGNEWVAFPTYRRLMPVLEA